MRIAILHYHLLRGGVTSVIRQQARSLAAAGEDVLILAGEGPEDSDGLSFEGCPLMIIPGLTYDGRRPPVTASILARKIRSAMETVWQARPDVLHVHNPLIRKNSILLDALSILAADGIRMLLQNHDFAEDFRPDVYCSGIPYVDDVHYATINGRDHTFLCAAGLNPLATHCLPNAVSSVTAKAEKSPTRYLYPVRGIRRKNIGEALLLSLFIPAGRTVALTLPPTSQGDMPSYTRWKKLSRTLDLPVEFEVGLDSSLPELFGSAVCALTTSVKEGFGFAFLEPWTAGLEVIGRRLGHVCHDFEEEGIRFRSLYDSLEIPLSLLPVPRLLEKLENAVETTWRAFRLSPPRNLRRKLEDGIASRPTFDFGRLDESLQEEVIGKAVSDKSVRDVLASTNPFLGGLATWEPDSDLVVKNRDCVLMSYSPGTALARLREAYRSTAAFQPRHHLDKEKLLEEFLDPFRFSLLEVNHG